MKPYYKKSYGKIYLGDALQVLNSIPDESINCCVTSPPYWGLRDYGVKGQLGLEKTPDEYVEKIVEIFREVKRVLRKDGTLWLNLGDTYNQGTKGNSGILKGECKQLTNKGANDTRRRDSNNLSPARSGGANAVCKPKDLIGIPWMVAFALRNDGWYLRQDIIWAKPNPMPESVKDRCTKAHEYMFSLSKSARYYYDHEAILEPVQADTVPRMLRGRSNDHKWVDGGPGNQTIAKDLSKCFTKKSGNLKRKENHNPNANFGVSVPWEGANRNKRSVWTIPTQPMPDAHFATFPEKLIKPCILAGCPKGGTVLDPFFGSGTTGIVAYKHDRKFIGIELSQTYLDDIAIPRINRETKQRKLFQ